MIITEEGYQRIKEQVNVINELCLEMLKKHADDGVTKNIFKISMAAKDVVKIADQEIYPDGPSVA